jgi:hypothetical protein
MAIASKEAIERAKRRKSPWNLVLISAVLLPLCAIWWGSFLGLEAVHAYLYPGQLFRNCSGVGTVLAAVAPVLGSVPISFLLGNLFVWSIPAARRTLDNEAKKYPSTSFKNSQQALGKIAIFVVPASVLVSIVGALLPWSSR